MPITFVPYTEAWVPAVEAMNERLRAANAPRPYFPTSPVPARLARRGPDDRLYRELFLATEGDAVHGGYALTHQDFYLSPEETASIGAFQLPVSEGAIDRRLAMIGPRLHYDVLSRNALLYTLGIGGTHESFARLLAGARWRLDPVPFFFRVVHGSTFFRNIAHLRTTRWRAAGFDLLAGAQLPGLLLRGFHALRDRGRSWRRGGRRRWGRVSRDDRFGSWADDIFREAREATSLIAVRSAEVLERLYPADDDRFIRLRVRTGDDQDAGWVVLMCNPLRNHRHFGNLRLGSIVDGLARPGSEGRVIRAATDFLQGAGADLIVSNQSHHAWCKAMRDCGYLSGPSNFLFAASPDLVKRLEPYDDKLTRVHMTRGDGDGPIHL